MGKKDCVFCFYDWWINSSFLYFTGVARDWERNDQESEGTGIKMKQFIKFGIVGLSNTLVSYLIYIVSLKIFQSMELLSKTDYLVSSVIAFFLSVLWSFYWNNKYTFKTEEGEKRFLGRALLKTYISYALTGLVLNNIFLYVWVQIVEISKDIAPVINLIITVPLNFLLNKYWAFKKS